jgi:predicted alpha/beta-hydrolase family hydrolase
MAVALRWTEPPGSPIAGAPIVVLTHGAGGAMDEPLLEGVARGLAAAGLRVARFEFPYMAARRADGKRRPPDRQPVLLATWRAVVAELRRAPPANPESASPVTRAGGPAGREVGLGADLVIGGKSMGGRMASLVADELGVRGLVCLGYPFHPPGKPQQLRTAHLAALRTPALIVQGTRDPFGGPDEVAGYALSPSIRVAWIEDGDHGLAPRRASGRTRAQNVEAAIAVVAEFVLRT